MTKVKKKKLFLNKNGAAHVEFKTNATIFTVAEQIHLFSHAYAKLCNDSQLFPTLAAASSSLFR